jgi:hypothetical protein
MKEVVVGDTVLPMDGDSAYHFRRITGCSQWPHVPYFDPRMNWPRGRVPLGTRFPHRAARMTWRWHSRRWCSACLACSWG